jgi:hypothetical protein
MKRALVPLLALGGCVTMSSSMLVGPALSLMYSPARVGGGAGTTSKSAEARLAARGHAALAAAAHDALVAAAASPTDVRLQRRAAAMVRAVAGDADARAGFADLAPVAARTLDHLVELAPCPGLADAAATWVALGDAARGGETYARAARQCDSVEAAIASVGPLRSVQKCDQALDVLRAAWPHVHGARAEVGIALLDGVAECSDAITLRRNLSFVPPDIVEDYFALLEARRQQELEAEHRADAERREQEAASRAAEASSRCESECSAAVSSCTSSCVGDAACNERCSSVGHVCRSGCGSY